MYRKKRRFMTRFLKKISGQIRIALLVLVLNLLFNLFLFIFVPYFKTIQSHHILWIVFVLSWFFYLLFFLVLRYNYTLPLKQLANNLKLVASGQKYAANQDQIGTEFRFVYLQIAALSRKQHYLLNQNSLLQAKTEAMHSEYETLEAEIEKLQDTNRIFYNTAILLNRISDSSQIWPRLIPDLIDSLEFDLCVVFRYDQDHLTFFDLGFKGLITTTERLKEKLNGYIIPSGSPEFALLGKSGVQQYDTVHFQPLLEEMHLNIRFSAFSIHNSALVFAGRMQTELKQNKQTDELLSIYAEMVQTVFNRGTQRKLNACDETARFYVLNETSRILTRYVDNEKKRIQWAGHDLLAPIRNVEGLLSSVYRKYENKLNDDLLNRLKRIESNINKERELIEALRTPTLSDPMEQVDLSELLDFVKEQMPYQMIRFTLLRPVALFLARPRPMRAALLLLFFNIETRFVRSDDTISVDINAIQDGNQIEIRSMVTTQSTGTTEDVLKNDLNFSLCRNLIYNAGGQLDIQNNTENSFELRFNFMMDT